MLWGKCRESDLLNSVEGKGPQLVSQCEQGHLKALDCHSWTKHHGHQWGVKLRRSVRLSGPCVVS